MGGEGEAGRVRGESKGDCGGWVFKLLIIYQTQIAESPNNENVNSYFVQRLDLK